MVSTPPRQRWSDIHETIGEVDDVPEGANIVATLLPTDITKKELMFVFSTYGEVVGLE